jgi:hypothetical protein
VSDFTTAFTVGQAPAEVFEAIRNVRGWWSWQIQGDTRQPGDEFTYRYEDLHRCRIRVVQADPSQKITWLVMDGDPAFTREKQQWRARPSGSRSPRSAGESTIPCFVSRHAARSTRR